MSFGVNGASGGQNNLTTNSINTAGLQPANTQPKKLVTNGSNPLLISQNMVSLNDSVIKLHQQNNETQRLVESPNTSKTEAKKSLAKTKQLQMNTIQAGNDSWNQLISHARTRLDQKYRSSLDELLSQKRPQEQTAQFVLTYCDKADRDYFAEAFGRYLKLYGSASQEMQQTVLLDQSLKARFHGDAEIERLVDDITANTEEFYKQCNDQKMLDELNETLHRINDNNNQEKIRKQLNTFHTTNDRFRKVFESISTEAQTVNRQMEEYSDLMTRNSERIASLEEKNKAVFENTRKEEIENELQTLIAENKHIGEYILPVIQHKLAYYSQCAKQSSQDLILFSSMLNKEVNGLGDYIERNKEQLDPKSLDQFFELKYACYTPGDAETPDPFVYNLA